MGKLRGLCPPQCSQVKEEPGPQTCIQPWLEVQPHTREGGEVISRALGVHLEIKGGSQTRNKQYRAMRTSQTNATGWGRGGGQERLLGGR